MYEWAPLAYRALNGVFCICKTSDLPLFRIIEIIKSNLVRDLNALPCYKYEKNIRHLTAKGSTGYEMADPAQLLDLSDHRLVLGPRYRHSDVSVWFLHGMARHSSGVLVCGIGKGCNYLQYLAMNRYLRVYHVKGKLGIATQNFTLKGHFIERTTYHHVTKPKLDKVCASTQSNHQRHMFEYANLNLQSQEAYEAASSGMIRPANRNVPPVIYGIKCIEFDAPDFTLEIHAINEKCTFLKQLVHDIGLILKSTAVCTKIQRIRYGHFTLEHALLRKFWTLEGIVENINYCYELTHPSYLLPKELIHKASTDDEKPNLLP